MKRIHYVNIGMAKTGSSSVFNTLTQHPEIGNNGQLEKENMGFSHFGWPIEKYIKYYESNPVSLNFNVATWTMSSDQIKQLSEFITHSSIILRKPVDFISSLYNFTNQLDIHTPELFIDMMLESNQLDYTKIIKHWKNNNNSPFLILFYEDLVSDPKMFYNSITDFLNLESYNFVPSKKNVTKYKVFDVTPTSIQIKKINLLINKLEDYLDKSLTHWKI